MKNSFVFFLLFILSLNTSYGTLRPKWILKATDDRSCSKIYFCAVGTGPNFKFAKIDAISSLSKIFERSIYSKYTSKLTASGEEATEELQESTRSALSGVEVIKTYEGEAEYYALARINKKKAAEGFFYEIKKLDKKMKVLIEDSKSSRSSSLLKKYYMQRELLNKKYYFLKGHSVKEVISYRDVFNSKKKLSHLIVHVYVDEPSPKSIEGLLISLLSDFGMKITTGSVRNIDSTNIVRGKLTFKKQYMKIDGFSKYKFVLEISANKLNRMKTGFISYSQVTTGRTFEQCFSKMLIGMEKFLNNNISELNIE